MKSLDKKKTEPKKLEWWKDKLKVSINDYGNEVCRIALEYVRDAINKKERNTLWKSEAEDLYNEIQSLIQSTKEETIREIMELECMKEEKHIKDKTLWDSLHYKACYFNLDADARNWLKNQIKEQLNSLLKK